MSFPQRSSTQATAAPMVPSLADAPSAPEIYRKIYVSLDIPREANPPIVGITSAISGEGRTTTALGLARTLANDLDVPIVLVEVDLERPTLARTFEIAPSPGLCDVLRGDVTFDEVMRPVASKLFVVTTGDSGPDTARLLRQLPSLDPFHGRDSSLGTQPALAGSTGPRLTRQLPPVDPFRRRQAPPRIVILDLPPIINHSYSPLACSVADAVVLVVRAGITPSDVIREAISRLEDRPPQGVVFNGPRSSLPAWWPGQSA